MWCEEQVKVVEEEVGDRQAAGQPLSWTSGLLWQRQEGPVIPTHTSLCLYDGCQDADTQPEVGLNQVLNCGLDRNRL